MQIFHNVNHAMPAVAKYVEQYGEHEETRNGSVISLPAPFGVTTLYPMQRVLLNSQRRANPYLFLLDGLSILSSVDFVKPFADITPRFREFSDDGVTLRGHYGRRLHMQIPKAIKELRENPNTRRVTLQIWNWTEDLFHDSKDIPCNLHVNLRIVRGALDLTVFNRSNDLYWGMFGANTVQFSFLQEYIATMVGVPVGKMHQITTNLHIYRDFGPGKRPADYYVEPIPEYPPVLGLDVTNLRADLDEMFRALNADVPLPRTENTFLNHIVYPMITAQRVGSPSVLNPDVTTDWFKAARMYG